MSTYTDIEEALDSLKRVLKKHQTNLYPRDAMTLHDALGVLEDLKQKGFE